MKSLFPIGSGVTLKDALKNRYPGLEFDIEDDITRGRKMIRISLEDTETYRIDVVFSQTLLAAGRPELMSMHIDSAVKRLREYVRQEKWGENNPSSRWYC